MYESAYIAKVYNDELAMIVSKHADIFVAAVSCLPFNNMEETLKEIDRTIN